MLDTAAHGEAAGQGIDAKAAASKLIRQWEAVFSNSLPQQASASATEGMHEEEVKNQAISAREGEDGVGRIVKSIDGKVVASGEGRHSVDGDSGLERKEGGRLAWKSTVRLLCDGRETVAMLDGEAAGDLDKVLFYLCLSPLFALPTFPSSSSLPLSRSCSLSASLPHSCHPPRILCRSVYV